MFGDKMTFQSFGGLDLHIPICCILSFCYESSINKLNEILFNQSQSLTN